MCIRDSDNWKENSELREAAPAPPSQGRLYNALRTAKVLTLRLLSDPDEPDQKSEELHKEQ